MTAPAGSPGATYTARPGAAARPGRPYPLGATVTSGGTNFAVASEVAHGITLCLVGAAGDETQIPLVDYDAGVWHAFVPGVGHGQAYGYRAAGPYDPAHGIRCNEAKLLLDPYARAVTGEMKNGPAVLGYSDGDADVPVATGGHLDVGPRSVIVYRAPRS